MALRLVIADDHPIVLQGLQDLFAQHADIVTVAACTSGAEALDAVLHHRPDVLLLDLKMEGLSGLDVLRQLNASGARCPTVILTAAATDEDVANALRLGVAGLILKDSRPEAVVDGVRQVALGRSWIDRDMLSRALAVDSESTAAGVPERTLTTREVEVIKLVAEGLRNKEIAGRLGIAEGTVKIHLHNIYDKLGVDGRLELVLAAQYKRLV